MTPGMGGVPNPTSYELDLPTAFGGWSFKPRPLDCLQLSREAKWRQARGVMRRGDFEDLVRRHLDGELVPRGFTLTPQPPADWDDDQRHAVYEARPDEFDRRYPALAVGGDPPCIDLWIQLDPRTGKVNSTLNGFFG